MEPNFAESPTAISLMEHRLLRFKGVLLPHHLLLQRMASLTILTEALVASVFMAVAPKGLRSWQDQTQSYQ